MFIRAIAVLLAVMWTSTTLLAQEAKTPASDTDNCFVALNLPGFFPGVHRGKPKQLTIYAVRRDGKFTAAVGNSNVNGKPTWNGGLYLVDFSNITVKDGKLTGPFSVTLTLDPWLPFDRKARVCTGQLDATLGAPKNAQEKASIAGTWRMKFDADAETATKVSLATSAEGTLTGGVGGVGPNESPDNSFDLWLPDFVPGPNDAGIQRRRVISLGWKDGKPVSSRIGDMGADNSISGYDDQPVPVKMEVRTDGFSARTKVMTTTLEGEPLQYDLTIEGVRVVNWVVGSWKATVTAEEGKASEMSGYFRGDVKKSAYVPEPVAKDERPASVPVKDWVPVKPGEHPRLLFRKTDIPALRAKAETPDGKRIVAQLKLLLGGGDAMPTSYSNEAPVNINTSNKKWPIGTFTMSHGAGFGMLYQLTGDKKYADLARQCVDKMLEGQVDRDPRYSYLNPGTGFRLGFVLHGIALAYDLCYDAWPEDYRKKVLTAVQDISVPIGVGSKKMATLEELAGAGGYPPGSNHYGAYLNAPGMAALAFRGDSGADNERLDKVLARVEYSLQKQLGNGFGDGGWFAEGTSCGRISSNGGILPLMQSLRIAAGKDYISPRPHGRYTVLRIMHELIRTGAGPQLPHRGGYGDDSFKPTLLSSMGDFAQGMGAVLPKEAEAMNWIYRTTIEPTGDPKLYDAVIYPHLAVYALVNWPEKATDPDEVLPRVIADNVHGYYVARNRWQDGDDIVVTTLLKRGPGGYKANEVKAGTRIWGLGAKLSLGALNGKTTFFEKADDGSILLADGNGNALAVDFSQASGAAALIAVISEQKDAIAGAAVAKQTTVAVGSVKVTVLTLSKGEHPIVNVADRKIVVGKQTLSLTSGRLVLSTFAAK